MGLTLKVDPFIDVHPLSFIPTHPLVLEMLWYKRVKTSSLWLLAIKEI